MTRGDERPIWVGVAAWDCHNSLTWSMMQTVIYIIYIKLILGIIIKIFGAILFFLMQTC